MLRKYFYNFFWTLFLASGIMFMIAIGNYLLGVFFTGFWVPYFDVFFLKFHNAWSFLLALVLTGIPTAILEKNEE